MSKWVEFYRFSGHITDHFGDEFFHRQSLALVLTTRNTDASDTRSGALAH